MDNQILKNFNQIYKELNFTKISEITDLLRDLNENRPNPLITRNHLNELSLKSQQLLFEALTINVLIRNDQDFNHRLTPPTIGLIFSEIITALSPDPTSSFIDLGSGTGSLIFTILANLKQSSFNATAIDNNEEMIEFSRQYYALFPCKNYLNFVFDDVISYQSLDQSDFIVSDVPIGYYPQKQNLKDYLVKSENSLTYVQNLFIEKGLELLQENGFAIFSVPQNIFTSKQSSVLLKMIKESAYIQGMISLPPSNFSAEKFQKYIIMLQKKGSWAHQIKPVLLYNLAELDDLASYKKLLTTLQAWGKEIKTRRN